MNAAAVNRAHRWRRGDGTVLSCHDLTQAVPMTLDELHDIANLIGKIEDWLLFDEEACDLLTYWLWAANCDPTADPHARHVIDALGILGATLQRILRAGIPNTGHIHPPTA
jgi:hypothetical protein